MHPRPAPSASWQTPRSGAARQRAHRNSGATATSTTASVHAEPSSSGGLRFLTEAEEKSCKDKLDECQADLDTCGSKKADDPSLLFVQMAQTCKLKEKSDGKGKTYYEFSSKDFDDDTYSFTDRPYRIAGTTPTKRFFKDFDTAFSEETGGKPNAVVTFRHEDAGNFEGPLITVFVEAAHRKDSGKYVYKLTQSEEQEKVHALKDFFRKGDGKDDGVVEYEMCSIFIDSTSDTCFPANVDSCRWDECVDQKDQCKLCLCCIDINGAICDPREPTCYYLGRLWVEKL